MLVAVLYLSFLQVDLPILNFYHLHQTAKSKPWQRQQLVTNLIQKTYQVGFAWEN